MMSCIFCSQSKPDVVGLLNVCSRLVPRCSSSIVSAAELISSAWVCDLVNTCTSGCYFVLPFVIIATKLHEQKYCFLQLFLSDLR